MEPHICVTERAGCIWVCFNRPQQMNPLDGEALSVLEQAVARARAEHPAALVITGSGPAFSAGADLVWLRRMLLDGGRDEVGAFFRRARDLTRALEELPVPTVAGVNGVCVAGGLELVCAMDLVVASDEAAFGDGHVNVGLLPVAGTARRLAARVGLSNARRLLFTGELIDAADAYRIGLANWLVPAAELETKLVSLCEQLASKAPDVLARMKRITTEALVPNPTGEPGDLELALAIEHLSSRSVREGITAFLEKRPPRFR